MIPKASLRPVQPRKPRRLRPPACPPFGWSLHPARTDPERASTAQSPGGLLRLPGPAGCGSRSARWRFPRTSDPGLPDGPSRPPRCGERKRSSPQTLTATVREETPDPCAAGRRPAPAGAPVACPTPPPGQKRRRQRSPSGCGPGLPRCGRLGSFPRHRFRRVLPGRRAVCGPLPRQRLRLISRPDEPQAWLLRSSSSRTAPLSLPPCRSILRVPYEHDWQPLREFSLAPAQSPTGGTRSGLRIWLDHPILAIFAPVDHIDFHRARVSKDKEVVPEKFKLQDRVLGGHRLHRKPFGPHNARLPGTGPLRGFGGGEEARLASGGIDTPPEDEFAAILLDLLLELPHHKIDRGIHVGGGIFPTQDDPVPPQRHFDDLCLAEFLTPLHAQHNLSVLDVVEIACEPVDLGLRVCPEGWGHIDVLTLHNDVQRNDIPPSGHHVISPGVSHAVRVRAMPSLPSFPTRPRVPRSGE